MRKIAGKLPDNDIKARVWREYAEVTNDEKLGLENPGGIDRIAECIGMVYGLDASTVLEEVPLRELMHVFGECYGFVSDLISGRIPKNASGDGVQ